MKNVINSKTKLVHVILIFCTVCSISDAAISQTIISGSSGMSIIPSGIIGPSPCAMLEISNPNKGLLIPRVALTATNISAPVSGPILSLLVYNTATAGPLAFNVTPGFYFWNGVSWERLSSGSSSGSTNNWSLLGNSGTVNGTNFIGTTDNRPFNIRVNNQRSGRIDNVQLNTFFGYLSGNSNSGSQSTAIGAYALSFNTTGYNNTATGMNALRDNTTGKVNTANGNFALFHNTFGEQNVACGSGSMYLNIGGSANTASGMNSLYHNTSGNANTAYGAQALDKNTIGWRNTAIGTFALNNNTTGNDNMGIGTNANVSVGNLTNASAIGANAIVNANNKARIGSPTLTVLETSFWSVPSDVRFKNNITETDVKGLEFIKRLRPVVFNFDTKKFEEFLTQNMPDSIKGKYFEGVDFKPSSSIRQSGFIAQEVEEAAKAVGYNFDAVHKPTNDYDNYSLSYSQFVVPLVKAMQEQQVMIDELRKKVAELEKDKKKN